MLGNYERPRFAAGEKVWLGRYRDLTNVLHWHIEPELIYVAEGRAQVCIGEDRFEAVAGEAFFCAGEQLHYIISYPNARVDVLIADAALCSALADYRLYSPRLPREFSLPQVLERIDELLRRKDFLYREALEHEWQGLMLEIFRRLPCRRHTRTASPLRDLLSHVHQELDHITFADAVAYSGYSPSHFSKLFGRLSGMSFSEYLNVLRVERFITRMRERPQATVTELALACGFSTVRNFNRVFKAVTGYTPRTMPKDFAVAAGLRTSGQGFDPTHAPSVLLRQ